MNQNEFLLYFGLGGLIGIIIRLVFLKKKSALTKKKIYIIDEKIYIASDEQFTEGDWVFNSHKVEFAPQVYEMPPHPIEEKWWDEEELSTTKKIIQTTDQQLIVHGVQAIDEEFLKWCVKNPPSDEIEIESNLKNLKKHFDLFSAIIVLVYLLPIILILLWDYWLKDSI
jgi:hypothetical protein